MTTTQIGGMPDPNAKRSLVDWRAIALELEQNPGVPILRPEFTDTESVNGIAATVNRAEGAPLGLRQLGGKVVAQMRSTRPISGRRRRGDVWLTWHPPTE